MDEAALTAYLTSALEGVHVIATEAVTSFSYDPTRAPGAGVFFATIKSRDDANDDVSKLDRPGVYRLNLGLSPDAYRARFGALPPPPGDDGLIETTHDFAALDQLMPHPVYAYLGWVCVLAPSAATFEALKPLMADAHAHARARHAAPAAAD